MLKVCLVIDTEKFISFKQGNPRWNSYERMKGRINNAIKNLRYNYEGFKVLYPTVLKNKFPTTFMLVGSLFKPFPTEKFIEWGFHTKYHSPLTLVNDEKVKREVQNIYKVRSFSPPLWMVEDSSSPDRVFNLIENEGYKKVIYRGIDHGLAHEHHFEVSPLKKRSGLKLVHVSNTFEGNSSKKHMTSLFKDILNNLDKSAVYCIASHDFTHRNNKNILRLIRFLKNLESQNKIQLSTVGDLK